MSMQGGKTIYSGSKIFWRSKLNLDIQIVNHPRFSTLEIIAYDSHLNVELQRLYANSIFIKEHVREDPNYLHLLEEKREWMTKNQINNEVEDIENAVILQLTNQYILSHLDVHVDENHHNHAAIILHKSFNETKEVLRERPENLIPFNVTPHEMFTTYKDFRDVLSHVETDFTAVELNSNLANNFEETAVAALPVPLTVFGFAPKPAVPLTIEHQAVLNKRKTLRKMSFSQHNVARLRWYHAIHKVIMHNKVQAIRRRLLQEELENQVVKVSHPHRDTNPHITDDQCEPIVSVFTSIQFPYSNTVV